VTREGRLGKLLRVLPADPQADGAIQILGLELYDDGLAVRWGALPNEPGSVAENVENAGINPIQLMQWTLGALPTQLPSPFPETLDEESLNPLGFMKVSDDLQTSYEPAGSSGVPLRGLAYFTPAIADEATWIEVFASKSGVVRFELSQQ